MMRSAVLLLLALAVGAGAAFAQDATLRGMVIDAAGEPAAGVPVALHRITDAGGALVDDAVSDADGRFAISVAGDLPDAIYFVAARYGDELYIGPTFRAPFPTAAEYVVQVGVPGTSASALVRGERAGDVVVATPPSLWRWALAAVVLLGIIVVGLLIIARAAGPPDRRRLLIRIARLDEAAAASDPDDPEYLLQRERLLDRLRASH
jgi:hypothetical protein